MSADAVCVFLRGVLVGVLLMLLLSAIKEVRIDAKWKQECVARGFAEYNKTGGEWQWKKETK